MKEDFAPTVSVLRKFCVDLQGNLVADGMTLGGLFPEATFIDVLFNNFDDDISALKSHALNRLISNVKEKLFTGVAAVLSSQRLACRADIAYLQGLDSELSVIRRKLHPRRIADHAPIGLWNEPFKIAAHEIGLSNLVDVLNSSNPTGRRVAPITRLALSAQCLGEIFWIQRESDIGSGATVIAQGLELFEKYKTYLAKNIQLQSRRSDGSVLKINVHMITRSMVNNTKRDRIIIPGFEGLSQKLSALQAKTNIPYSSQIVEQAVSLYYLMLVEHNLRNRLEYVHPAGGIEPVKFRDMCYQHFRTTAPAPLG